MLTIIGAALGFLAPMVPELFKWLNRREDNKHEIKMLQMQGQIMANEHMYRMEEISARADIAEAQVLRTPQASFGSKILDAMNNSARVWPLPVAVPLVYLFSFMDFFIGMVRPIITYAIVAFYALTKWARYEVMSDLVTPDTPAYKVFMNLWGEQDFAVLSLVLCYWFGHRTAKYAFGWDKK